MKKYDIPTFSDEDVKALSCELVNNDYICETAGFEPLEVKFKKFENAGLMNMIQRQELTSADYREMYLNPDFDVSIDDDPDEIIEKMHKLQDHIFEIQKKAAERNSKVGSSERTANSPSGSAAVETKEKVEAEAKE